MKNFSAAYSSKLHLAIVLANLKCRAVTITAVARTKPADSREIYKRVHKEQSESGQTPTNHSWFLQTQTRRLHAALLLIFYNKYRMRYEQVPDAHGIAFSLTFNKYINICDDEPLVSPERFNLLLSGFAIGWKDILKGTPSNYSSENVKIICCKICHIPHLSEAHFLNYSCPTCNV